MGSQVHGFFCKRCEAMTERSVQSRVFVSPFRSYERGETWQKNHTNKLSWRKTSSEAHNLCAYCSIPALSSHVISCTKSARDAGLLLLNWLESLAKSLPSKKIQCLRDNYANAFRVSIMLKLWQMTSYSAVFLTENTKYLPIFHTTLRQTLYARFFIRLLRQAKRIW